MPETALWLQVFEYINTDLKRYMEASGRGPSNPLPKSTVKSFIFQLILGTAHIHRHGVMHRFDPLPTKIIT